MSTGQKTQATIIQGSQGTVEQDVSHSALYYLFQEVSRLASPLHSSFLDPSSPSKWLDETSKQENSINKEEDSARLFHTLSSSCQHALSHRLPSQVKKVKEESDCSNITTVAEPQCNSPWKVLSLINLQCERLQHQRDQQGSDSSSGSSTTKSCPLTAKSSATADVTDQEDGGDAVNVERTSGPTIVICKRQEITASVGHVDDVTGMCSTGTTNYQPQSCVKGSKVDCSVQPQDIEKAETVMSEGNTTASSQPQHGDKMEVKFSVGKQLELNQGCKEDLSAEQDFVNVPRSSENTLSQTHVLISSVSTQLVFKSNEDTRVALSKAALPLDHNANIALSAEASCDSQIPPLNTTLPSSLLPSLPFSTPEGCFSLPESNNKIPGSPAECTHASRERKSSPAKQLKSSGCQDPEPWLVEREEISHSSLQQWRTKTPRKQPHPSRSADIQDPDFQGVTFSMDTELDDSREQCRLLITSKYRYWQI